MATEALTTLFTNIANAIRSKSGTSAKMLPRDMGNVIRSIKNVPHASQQGTLNGIFQDMADAIRACGVAGTMTPMQIPDKVLQIPAEQVEFVIQAEDEFTGSTMYCKCLYDNALVAGQWSLTSGSQYATINQNGRVDIQSGTQNQTIVVSCQYDGHTATKSILVSYDNQLTIECAETLSGTQAQLIARYNGSVVQGQWSISSGQQYASINDSSGLMTISASGSVVVQVSYGGYTTQKTVQVQYVANQQSQTVVNDDGSVTTETTTTTTNQDGSTTTETTSTTTNEDGSYSQNASTTTQNQDGSSTTTSSTTNSDGTSSQTTSSTSAPDSSGSTTTTSATTNYDESGNVSGSQQSQKTSNSDGSSASTTTNYNANGDPTDKTNQNVDVSGNEQTQNIEYDQDGNEEVVGYQIDTSNNQSGSMELADPIDTGVLAFDGRDFDIMVKARFTFASCTKTVGPIVNMSSKDTGKVNGILIYESRSTSGSCYSYSGQKRSGVSAYNKFRITKYLQNKTSEYCDFVAPSLATKTEANSRVGYAQSTSNPGSPVTATFVIRYRSGVFTLEMQDESGSQAAVPSKNMTFSFIDVGEEFQNITVQLGEWDSTSAGVHYEHSFDILDFNVKKL